MSELTVKLASSYLANHAVPASDIPRFIASVHQALASAAGKPEDTVLANAPVPAIAIKKSVTPGAIYSLEDGKPYKTLKRHLARRGLTPEAYRAKWKLPADYPMVATEYSKHRSALATSVGLGRKPAASVATAGKPGRLPRA